MQLRGNMRTAVFACLAFILAYNGDHGTLGAKSLNFSLLCLARVDRQISPQTPKRQIAIMNPPQNSRNEQPVQREDVRTVLR